MKWIDIPPIWLFAHLIVAWLWAPYDPLSFGGAWAVMAGTFVIIAGLSLMLFAVWEMWRAKTTPIPHMEPDALVSTGIFSMTRNPIYLGDALIIVGVALRADAPLALILVPVFMAIIVVRFIRAEEARLERHFGPSFVHYCTQTRRWL